MLSNKELQILSILRNDARKSAAKISREINVPTSTVFDKIKKFEKRFINSYVTLVDFSMLNYGLRVNFAIKVNNSKKDDLREYLMNHTHTNSLLRINNGHDFFVECVFKNMKQLSEFKESLEDRGVEEKKEFHVIEDIKKEAFLTEKAHYQK